MKVEFCAISSSVIPIAFRSLSNPFQEGSTVSMGEGLASGLEGWFGVGAAVGSSDVACLGGIMEAAGGGGAGADEDRWPKRLPRPNRLWLFPLETGAGAWPRGDENGVAFVSLLALFSRSWTFFKNVLASFSSENEKPARHSSSSKVWKKVRS